MAASIRDLLVAIDRAVGNALVERCLVAVVAGAGVVDGQGEAVVKHSAPAAKVDVLPGGRTGGVGEGVGE